MIVGAITLLIIIIDDSKFFKFKIKSNYCRGILYLIFVVCAFLFELESFLSWLNRR